MPQLTPMMRQYQEIKTLHPDKILFFRVGDFYETFFEDAALAAEELDITLTSRDSGKVPLAGVPYHALNNYLARLINKGYKVAICEQVENPAEAKGLVRREVTRIVTPGTVFEPGILEDKQNNYLVAVIKEDQNFGLAYIDVSTGEMAASELSNFDELEDELARLAPREVICNNEDIKNRILTLGIPLVGIQEDAFVFSRTKPMLKNKFGSYLQGIKDQKEHGLAAAGALLYYLQGLQQSDLGHVNQLRFYSPGEFMELDAATRRNLELVVTLRERTRKGSLLWVLDHTVTAGGGRMLRRWVERPLKNLDQLLLRQGSVAELADWGMMREELSQMLQESTDLERLLGRAIFGSLLPREMGAVRDTLKILPALKNNLQQIKSPGLEQLREQIPDLKKLSDLLNQALMENPPASAREGGIIKQNYNSEVDRFRSLSSERKQWIAGMETRERKRTNIKSLKISYNRVFGYYIEVTRSNLSSVPKEYIRKQTLVNCERYITDELKKYEEEVLGAEEKLKDLEYRLYEELRKELVKNTEPLQKTAQQLACLDCYISMARTALANRYTKPRLTTGKILDLRQMRHPVVEAMQKDPFIPNNIFMNNQERALLITGPNMAGKSTYCRSVALTVLLAQIGSFVPARNADIGICDRIFARVGASDDLASGVSTFMLEMQETAAILAEASEKSLVILDEVGRGTSTFDGMSIARAVLEDLHDRVKCRILFSTHYHELTTLEQTLPALKNYTMAVTEKNGRVVFLRQVIAGKADRSYGVNVARLAGLPPDVVSKSAQYLKELEENRTETAATVEDPIKTEEKINPLVTELAAIDPENLTPRQALDLIYKLSITAKEQERG